MKNIKSQKAIDLIKEYVQDIHLGYAGDDIDHQTFLDPNDPTKPITKEYQDQIADEKLKEIKAELDKTHYEVWEKGIRYIGDKRKPHNPDQDYTQWRRWFITDNKQEALAEAKSSDVPCRVIETKIIDTL